MINESNDTSSIIYELTLMLVVLKRTQCLSLTLNHSSREFMEARGDMVAGGRCRKRKQCTVKLEVLLGREGKQKKDSKRLEILAKGPETKARKCFNGKHFLMCELYCVEEFSFKWSSFFFKVLSLSNFKYTYLLMT